MKRTALALILALLFSAIAGTKIINLAESNPGIVVITSPPEINVLSPVENQTYPSNDVWLNFTVIRPADWLYNNSGVYLSQGRITYAQYSVRIHAAQFRPVDANISGEIDVDDPLNAENPPSNFSFSLNLEGLPDGQHRLEVSINGYFYSNRSHTSRSQTILFTVYTPEPEEEPFPAALVVAPIVAVSVAVLGLLIYLRKRRRQTEMLSLSESK
jgi:hypothetical protein